MRSMLPMRPTESRLESNKSSLHGAQGGSHQPRRRSWWISGLGAASVPHRKSGPYLVTAGPVVREKSPWHANRQVLPARVTQLVF